MHSHLAQSDRRKETIFAARPRNDAIVASIAAPVLGEHFAQFFLARVPIRFLLCSGNATCIANAFRIEVNRHLAAVCRMSVLDTTIRALIRHGASPAKPHFCGQSVASHFFHCSSICEWCEDSISRSRSGSKRKSGG